MTANQESLCLDDVLKGRIAVQPAIRVSAKSRFGDDQWDFTDGTFIRLSSVPAARLRIDWAGYCTDNPADNSEGYRSAKITPTMVNELRVFAFLYLKLPGAFGSRGPQSVKAHTVVVSVRAIAHLLSDILVNYQLAGLGGSRTDGAIRSIQDISLLDIRNALDGSPRADGTRLKKALKLLASPVMRRALSQFAVKWNAHDVATLPFKYPKKRSDYKSVMPNDLFRLLSNTACADVLGFLRFVGLEAHDKTSVSTNGPFSATAIDGAELLADYISIRDADRASSARAGKRQCSTQTKRKKFKQAYGVSPSVTFKWLYRVQRAAFTVIGLYTGARYSDLTTFTTSCIKTHHGAHVLAGTLVKHEEVDAPEGRDLWPAIPIMRDAVACLEQIARFTFNPYLLSGSESVPIGVPPRALTLTGFTDAVNHYLHEIDSTNRWVDWHINAHQLRHTLAHQLARADVGLIFIAHQMKHLYTALHALPPDVTMMYGNVGDLATQRALHSGSAYLEAAIELYSPDRPVAGGGAKAFKARRRDYFEGMAAQGWSVDEVLEQLAKQGLPFASVGIGYCGGRRDTLLKDGTKERPPCIGSLQCNPSDCSQAVITRTHEPAWRKILCQNRALVSDPRMAHAKEHLLTSMKTAEKVLAELSAES